MRALPTLYALKMADVDLQRLRMAASLSGRKASKIAREGIRKAISEQLAAIADEAAQSQSPATKSQSEPSK